STFGAGSGRAARGCWAPSGSAASRATGRSVRMPNTTCATPKWCRFARRPCRRGAEAAPSRLLASGEVDLLAGAGRVVAALGAVFLVVRDDARDCRDDVTQLEVLELHALRHATRLADLVHRAPQRLPAARDQHQAVL